MNTPITKLVNIVGKHIYKTLDGAFKITYSANMCDVYVTLLYAIPEDIVKIYNFPNGQDVQEVTLDINITTYTDKLRVNVIEMTTMERTLGFDTYVPEKYKDVKVLEDVIIDKVLLRVNKAYSEYELLI